MSGTKVPIGGSAPIGKTPEQPRTDKNTSVEARAQVEGLGAVIPLGTGRGSGHLDLSNASRSFPLVQEGEHWHAGMVRAERGNVAGRPKIFLIFKIVTAGPSFGVELFMSCTVATNGRWARSSKFLMAWMIAAGTEPPRRDRLSTRIFEGKLFRVRVRTVKRTWQNALLPPHLQYSIIDCLLEVVAGGSTAPPPSRSLRRIGTLGSGSGEEKNKKRQP
jgi:hypothetical protein